MAVWVSYGHKLMLYSPTGSAERNRAERRGQLPAVPKSRLTTTHLNKQQSKTLSTPNRDRARQKGSNKLLSLYESKRCFWNCHILQRYVMLIFNFDCRMIAQVIGWEVTSLQTISLNSDWLQSLTQRSATRLRCIFMPVGNQLALLLIVFYTNPMLPSTHAAKSLLVEDFLNFHIKSMRFWLDSECN